METEINFAIIFPPEYVIQDQVKNNKKIEIEDYYEYGYVTPNNTITGEGWKLIEENYEIIEGNIVKWLEKNFESVKGKWIDAFEEFSGSIKIDTSDKKQMSILNDKAEFVDHDSKIIYDLQDEANILRGVDYLIEEIINNLGINLEFWDAPFLLF